MMKRLLFLCTALSSQCFGQNLVPNGSFENGICSQFSANIHIDCENWFASIQEPGTPWIENPSPDWFHTCALSDGLRPPATGIGFQEPYDGEGYAGGAVWQFGVPTSREILGVGLVEPMEIGESYLIRFKINRPNGGVDVMTNNYGFKLTTYPFFFSFDDAINNQSHFKLDSLVTDTLNWLSINHEIIADSAYSYIHFGNFFTDEETEVVFGSENYSYAYYFIDDVSITSTLSSSSETERISRIFPNPANTYIQVSLNNNNSNVIGQIIDVSGRILMQQSLRNADSIDISSLSQGIYIFRLNGKGLRESLKFIKE